LYNYKYIISSLLQTSCKQINASLWDKSIKGHLLCKIRFCMVFGHKCVLAVCVHNHLRCIFAQAQILRYFEQKLQTYTLWGHQIFILNLVKRLQRSSLNYYLHYITEGLCASTKLNMTTQHYKKKM